MKILILGGGLIGVCSAYFLQKSGHDVTVIERQNDVGLETSFANGGQISVSYAEPWSNFNNLKKIITWIGNENSPLLYRPKLDTHQLLWSLQFLYQSFPKNYHNSIEKLLNLAIFSRKELKKLREELNLDYQQIEKGILTFYTSMKSFSNAKKLAIFANTFGAERVIKNIHETLDIEPSLKYSQLPIIGSDYTEKDETGNAFLFLQKLKIECEKIGVHFLFNSEIQDVQINQNEGSIDKIFYKKIHI
jgi:D-amino-acid dehydrogenase